MDVVLHISPRAGAPAVRLHLRDTVQVPERTLAALLAATLRVPRLLRVSGIALRIASIVPSEIRPPGAHDDAAIVLPLSSVGETPEYFGRNAQRARWVALYQEAGGSGRNFYINDQGRRVHTSSPGMHMETVPGDADVDADADASSEVDPDSGVIDASQDGIFFSEGRGRPQSAASSDRSFGGRRHRPGRSEGRGRPLSAVPSDKLHGGKRLRPTRREGTGRPLSASPSDRPPMYHPSPDGQTNRKNGKEANAWEHSGRPMTAPAGGRQTRGLQGIVSNQKLDNPLGAPVQVRQAWGESVERAHVEARVRDDLVAENIDDSSSVASSRYSTVAHPSESRSGSVNGEEETDSFMLNPTSSEMGEGEDDLDYSIEEQSITMNLDGSISALEPLDDASSGASSGNSDSDSDEDSVAYSFESTSSKDSDKGDQVEDWHHREDLFDSSGIAVSVWANDDLNQDFRTAGNTNIRTTGLGPL